MTTSPASSHPSPRSLMLIWLVTAFLGLGIALGTLWPTDEGPTSPFPTDKVMHFVAFALLILPMACTDRRRALWLLPACIAFGGAIELIQPTFGRSAEWLDFLADALGVGLGLMLGTLVRRRRAGP